MEEKPARSPLTQGGLEVKCSVTASWTNEKGITLLKKLVDEKYSFDKRLEDESADIIKKLFPDTTEQDDDDYLGYGLQLLEIYDSDEEGEDENINWYINVFRLKLIYFKYVFHWILANNEIDM